VHALDDMFSTTVGVCHSLLPYAAQCEAASDMHGLGSRPNCNVLSPFTIYIGAAHRDAVSF